MYPDDQVRHPAAPSGVARARGAPHRACAPSPARQAQARSGSGGALPRAPIPHMVFPCARTQATQASPGEAVHCGAAARVGGGAPPSAVAVSVTVCRRRCLCHRLCHCRCGRYGRCDRAQASCCLHGQQQPATDRDRDRAHARALRPNATLPTPQTRRPCANNPAAAAQQPLRSKSCAEGARPAVCAGTRFAREPWQSERMKAQRRSRAGAAQHQCCLVTIRHLA